MGLFSSILGLNNSDVDNLIKWINSNTRYNCTTKVDLLKVKKINMGSLFSDDIISPLSELPKNIDLLKNLEELDLQNHNISKLPKEIGKLKKLKKLKMGGNNLKTLPKEIGGLEQLNMLTLWENNIIEFPDEIVNLKNLNGLSIWGNPIEFNNLLTYEQMVWLKYLEDSGCDLENFDKEITFSREIKYQFETSYYDQNYFGTNIYRLSDIDNFVDNTYPNLRTKKDSNMIEKIKIYDSNGSYLKDLSDKYMTLIDKIDDKIEYNKLESEDKKLCDDLMDEESNEEYYFDLDNYQIEYIYHMTHYKNLESILENGLLAHNNELVNEHIDNDEVNDRRDKKESVNNYNIHSYVPLYFNPKNPMLYFNKDIQDDIVILAFDRELLYAYDTIFSDGNAASSKTKFYEELDDLDCLNWDCIFSNYWNNYEDGKREVMAEILVHNKVPISYLQKIICFDKATESYILDLDDKLDVEIDEEKYFN